MTRFSAFVDLDRDEADGSCVIVSPVTNFHASAASGAGRGPIGGNYARCRSAGGLGKRGKRAGGDSKKVTTSRKIKRHPATILITLVRNGRRAARV